MDLLSKLQKEMNSMKELFNSRMATFENSISTQAPAPPAVRDDFNSFKDFIGKMVSGLQNQMDIVLKTLEEMETRSRAGILLLHGVPEAEGEIAPSKVTDICQNRLQLSDITTNSFVSCHRLGKNKAASKPRAILIKFSCSRTRDVVWAAKKLLKGSGFTLSEFLTNTRHAVFLEARRIYGVKGSWTSDGRIVVVCPDGSRHKITTMDELRALPLPSDANGAALKSTASVGAEASGEPVLPNAANATSAAAARRVLPNRGTRK
ncbi:uncharacterized protein LOC134671160 [Cydia fagiglandana]|uniref:uncharacterized protein LOC134671160 n=1 Tax=Cydia fagiglandana TaxID=1458189 RepID=UPI002FEE29C8